MTTTTSLHLRDYQTDAIDSLVAAWNKGIRRPAVVLPTGGGKTVIFAHLTRRWICDWDGSYTRGVVVIVHREELITQTVRKLHEVDPSLKVGVVKAGRNEINGFDVMVCSIQTIRKSHRLDQFEGIGLVIVDECHHAAADSYVSVMDHFEESGAVFAGFTATMDRDDSRSLGDVWNEIVCTRDVLDLIGEGHLTDVEGKMVTIDGLSLNKAKMTRGDFSDVSLSDLLLDVDAQTTVANAYHEHAREADGSYRKGLLFAPTVIAAKAFASAFNDKGIPTEVIWGTMPSEDRNVIIKKFIAGEIRVLSNCMVLTEGFDVPDTSVVVIARPTKSASLYVQMVGRGLRPFPGKIRALVLDVVGASEDHTLATLADLSSRRVDVVEPGETLIGAAKRLAKKGVASLKGYINHKDVDLFHRSASMWQRTDAGLFFISTTCEEPETCSWSGSVACKGHLVFLWPGQEFERYKVGVCPTYAKGGRWIHDDVSLTFGMSFAEEFAGKSAITNKKASWRKRSEPATPAQVGYATRLGISVPTDVTKSQLSDMINIRVASNRLDPKRKDNGK
jgi:superfamily II DNA or RNA helicase